MIIKKLQKLNKHVALSQKIMTLRMMKVMTLIIKKPVSVFSDHKKLKKVMKWNSKRWNLFMLENEMVLYAK